VSAAAECEVVGRWRIVGSDLWDRDDLDLVDPALISIGRGGRGELAFGVVNASLDLAYSRTMVFFTFEGFDEGDEVDLNQFDEGNEDDEDNEGDEGSEGDENNEGNEGDETFNNDEGNEGDEGPGVPIEGDEGDEGEEAQDDEHGGADDLKARRVGVDDGRGEDQGYAR